MYKIPAELKSCYFLKHIKKPELIMIARQNKTNILMIIKDCFNIISMSKVMKYINKISIRMLIEFGDEVDLHAIVSYENTSSEMLKICFKKFKSSYCVYDSIALSFAKNKNTPIYILNELIKYQNSPVHYAALRNKELHETL